MVGSLCPQHGDAPVLGVPEGIPVDVGAHLGEEGLGGRHGSAGKHDDLGVVRVDGGHDGRAEVPAERLEDLQRHAVACLRPHRSWCRSRSAPDHRAYRSVTIDGTFRVT